MASKFMEALSDEGGASITPMHPFSLAATFHNRRDPGVLLNFLCRVKSTPVGSHRGLQPRRQSGPSSWEAIEDLKVRMLSKYLLDLSVEVTNGGEQGS